MFSRLTALTGLCLMAATPGSAWSQQAYGKVLDAAPIYEEVAIPQQICTPYGKQQRCENSTVYEEKLVGYDVLYEYNGQQHMQRMADHPGQRVQVQAEATRNSYGSKERASGAIATPGKKSYGSVAPGAPIVESIEYQGEDVEPLLNLDMRIRAPQHRH